MLAALPHSFDRIALSLSGGGFRAAAFHLGALRLLHRLGLLTHVRALSTASGGTIIGAHYVQSLVESVPFESWSATFRELLVTRDFIDEALEQIPAKRTVRTTLITAAADAYASIFHGTLGEIIAADTHLEELSFNATDMRNGLAFRFVKSVSHLVRSGNRFAPIPPDVAARLRLADIVAASSCFPAAFEPIVFPDDFVLDIGAKQELASTPLMDGGIYDNLGVDSLLLVRNRRRHQIDAIIVSDADTNAPPLYVEPALANSSRLGAIRVRTVYYAVFALGAMAAGSCLALAREWRLMWPSLIVQLACAALCFAIVLGIRVAARQPISGRARPALWHRLGRLTLGELFAAGATRGVSLVSLTSRIFMKRLRTLTYQRLFERAATSSRTIGNLIGDLAGDETVPIALREFAQRAAAMPTTLWADSPQEIDDVIQLGELTLCRNLLRRLEAGGDVELRAALSAEWSRLSADVPATILP